jgi:hypothetical protein
MEGSRSSPLGTSSTSSDLTDDERKAFAFALADDE